ncbi:MAG TPA: hypothetical protein VF251_08940 [Pyrinomonadaceae bacterium]
MKRVLNKRLAAIVLSIVATSAAFGFWLRRMPHADAYSPPSAARSPLDSLPDTVLWAWERPEQLDFIDTKRIGVAYLAKTIQIRDNDLFVRPRLQPLILRPDTRVVAVVRIETPRFQNGPLLESRIEQMADEIAEASEQPGVVAVQIDFDAKASERSSYRKLLVRVRELLPRSIPLSITALASWCAGDNWVSDLPVDEVVPMLFRLGVNRDQFAARLQSDEVPFSQPCHLSAGVSTDENIHPPKRKRLYIFSPKPWTPSAVNAALETYRR